MASYISKMKHRGFEVGPDGDINAVYQYGQLELDPHLTDADFDISTPNPSN